MGEKKHDQCGGKGKIETESGGGDNDHHTGEGKGVAGESGTSGKWREVSIYQTHRRAIMGRQGEKANAHSLSHTPRKGTAGGVTPRV